MKNNNPSPCTSLIFDAGKSYVLKSMLSNAAKVFKPMPKRILFFYSVYQELYTEIAKQVYDNSNIVIDFQNGSTQEIISPEQLRDYTKGEPALVIFDGWSLSRSLTPYCVITCLFWGRTFFMPTSSILQT